MKTTKFLLSAAVISMMAVSCSGGGDAHTEESHAAEPATTEAAPVAAATYMVDAEASIIRWKVEHLVLKCTATLVILK